MPSIRAPRSLFDLPAPALACLFALALAGCQARSQAPIAAARAEAARVTGVYAMPPPLTSELRVVALPGHDGEYRIEVHGAGDPADGAAAGADCHAVAEGPLAAGQIDAGLVPFKSASDALDAADLQPAPRLRLRVRGDVATLEGDFAHCPMRTVMAGTYRRTSAPRLLDDCAPLPAACWNRD